MLLPHLKNIYTCEPPIKTPLGVVGFVRWVSPDDGDEYYASAMVINVGSQDRLTVRFEHNNEVRRIYRSQFMLLLTTTPGIIDVWASMQTYFEPDPECKSKVVVEDD